VEILKKIQKERVIKDDSFNLEIEMSKVKKHLPSPSHPHGPKTEEGELNRIIFTETAFKLLSLYRMKFRYLWYENLNFQIANLYMKNVFVHLFI
jgi:hypothetical protein